MSSRGLLSDAEMAALLAGDDEGGEGDTEGFDVSLLFTPHDFADFCDLVAPFLLEPFSRLSPLVDAHLAADSPQLALIAPDAVTNVREPRWLFVPLDVTGSPADDRPDSLLEISGTLARRLALLMIGGDDDDGDEVDDAHLSSLAEFFRQYRVQVAAQDGGKVAERSSAARRASLRPVISGKKTAGKLLKRIFGAADHLVGLTARCTLDGVMAGEMRFVFPVGVSSDLLQRRRAGTVNGAVAIVAPPTSPSVSDAAPSRETVDGTSVALRVTARLGSVPMSRTVLATLTPGVVVRLDSPAGEEVDLVVGDAVVARGEVVVDDDHYAVRVRVINAAAIEGSEG